MLISEEELVEFLSINEVNLQSCIGAIIRHNRIIGVGLITLEEQLVEIVRSHIRKG